MLEILAVFSALPGQEAALRAATLAIVEPSRREAGCERFDVAEDSENPGTFFIRETWRDREALELHFTQPYLVALQEQHKTLLAAPLKLHILRTWP